MPPLKTQRGTLPKYVRLVKSASEGCVTDDQLNSSLRSQVLAVRSNPGETLIQPSGAGQSDCAR